MPGTRAMWPGFFGASTILNAIPTASLRPSVWLQWPEGRRFGFRTKRDQRWAAGCILIETQDAKMEIVKKFLGPLPFFWFGVKHAAKFSSGFAREGVLDRAM